MITSAWPRKDCRAAFHATGRCTRASGQYWPGAELIQTGGGALRNKSPILREKMRSQGSGSTTKRRPAAEAVKASLETAFLADCISLVPGSEKDYIFNYQMTQLMLLSRKALFVLGLMATI